MFRDTPRSSSTPFPIDERRTYTSGTYVRAVRGFNRDVRLYLAATALLGFAVFGGIYPVLFNIHLLRLGNGTEFIGWANSIVMLTFAMASPIAGNKTFYLDQERTGCPLSPT